MDRDDDTGAGGKIHKLFGNDERLMSADAVRLAAALAQRDPRLGELAQRLSILCFGQVDSGLATNDEAVDLLENTLRRAGQTAMRSDVASVARLLEQEIAVLDEQPATTEQRSADIRSSASGQSGAVTASASPSLTAASRSGLDARWQWLLTGIAVTVAGLVLFVAVGGRIGRTPQRTDGGEWRTIAQHMLVDGVAMTDLGVVYGTMLDERMRLVFEASSGARYVCDQTEPTVDGSQGRLPGVGEATAREPFRDFALRCRFKSATQPAAVFDNR